MGAFRLFEAMLAFITAAVFLVVLQPRSPAETPIAKSSELTKPGAVVELVWKGYAADAAGIKEGDLLLSWSRNNLHGLIESPSSLWKVENEQMPRGPVTLYGFRGSEKKHWRLFFSRYWAMQTRPNFTAVVDRLYSKGREQAKDHKYTEAVENWGKIQKAADDHGDRGTKAWLDYQAAMLLAEAHLWQDSGDFFRAGIEELKGEPYIAAQFLKRWGYIEDTRGELEIALAKYSEAYDLIRKPETETFLSSQIVQDMASLYERLGQPEEARRSLEKAYQTDQRLDPGSTAILLVLADDEFFRGDLAKAETHYRLALACALKRSIKEDVVRALMGLGIVSHMRGDLSSGKKYYREAINVMERSNNLHVAYALDDLGLAFQDGGNFKLAETYFRRAFALEKKSNERDFFLARILNHLGDVLRREGRLSAAEIYLKEALEIRVRLAPASLDLAWTYSDLGEVYRARGNFVRAESEFRKALAIREKLAPGSLEHADVLSQLAATLASQGKKDDARTYYERALTSLETQSSRLGGSSTIRASFRAKHERFYHEYAGLLLSQHKFEEAFSVLERSRARTLLETLNAAHIDIHNGADKTLLGRERSLQLTINAKSERRAHLFAGQHTDEQIKAVEKEISDLTGEYQDVEAQIRATSPAYAALTQPQPLTTKQIQQQLLDQDTLLLEYSLGEERSYVFAVTPDSLHAYQLPGRAAIERQARNVHRLITAQGAVVRGELPVEKRHRMARDEISYERSVAELSRMILGPVKDEIKNKRLLVVTDGALAYVPFSLLPEPRAPDRSRSREAAPLIVHHEIVNLPSASVLAVLRQQEIRRKPAPMAVAVLADPVFDVHDPRVTGATAPKPAATSQSRGAKPDPLDDLLAGDFSANLLTRSATDLGLARDGQLVLPRLRFTRMEADAIMRVTPQGKGLEAVDFKANRSTVTSPELGDYRIVHFATHGLLNSEHPELSGLVLSLVDKTGKPQNGFLTLEDIYNLNLRADLVVLSACETGLGKQISGEGVIGLTRGFMYAGASRVVASLWNVSDVATAQLMANFYRSMETDGLAPAAALRAAQIAMWKQRRWRHPYYWAAFQIQGEWK